MQEKLKREVLTNLSNFFKSEELAIVEKALIVSLNSYEITQRSTEIVLYNMDFPEIKSHLVCKGIKGLADGSLKRYKSVLEHFAYNLGKDVKKATTNDIRLYLFSYEQTHKVSKSTLDGKRIVINGFYNWMLNEDLITKNPMSRIDSMKVDEILRDPLTMMELEQMRGACVTTREKAMLELMYSTGCRVGEIIKLNKQDIDFQNGKVKVFGKGKKERYAFLNAKSQLAIKKYIFSRADNEEALFVAGKRPYNRLGKGTFEKEIGSIGIRAGIHTPVFPHRIRHTTATHMLNNGASLADVQKLLGHKSSQTTLIYAKLDINNLQSTHRRCII